MMTMNVVLVNKTLNLPQPGSYVALSNMAGGNPDHDRDSGSGLAVEAERPKLQEPKLFKVLLLNDDYTPMEFVVEVLEKFFGLGRSKATQVMLEVHTKGRGICGLFTAEIAETKVSHVNDYARSNQHPLLCSMEAD